MHHIRSKLFSQTLFKTTFLVQLVFGKNLYKSIFKSIQVYSNQWILPVTDFLELLALRRVDVPFLKFCLPINVMMPEAIFFIKFSQIQNSTLSVCSYDLVYKCTYTSPIATKIINYKNMLQDLNIDFKSKPPDSVIASVPPFIYNPAGLVITGGHNIFSNTSLQNVLYIMPKYPEPESINSKSKF